MYQWGDALLLQKRNVLSCLQRTSRLIVAPQLAIPVYGYYEHSLWLPHQKPRAGVPQSTPQVCWGVPWSTV